MVDSTPSGTPVQENPADAFSQENIKGRIKNADSSKEEIKGIAKDLIEILQDLSDYIWNRPEEDESQIAEFQNRIKSLEKLLNTIREAASKSANLQPEEVAKTVIDCIHEMIRFINDEKDPLLKKYFEENHLNFLKNNVARVEMAQKRNPRIYGSQTAVRVREQQLFQTFLEEQSAADNLLGQLSGVKKIPEEVRKMLMEVWSKCSVMKKTNEELRSQSMPQLIEDYANVVAQEVVALRAYYDGLVGLTFDIDEVAIRKPFEDQFAKLFMSENTQLAEKHRAKSKSVEGFNMHLVKIEDEGGPILENADDAVREARLEAKKKAIESRPDLTNLKASLDELRQLKRRIIDILNILSGVSKKVHNVLQSTGLENNGKPGSREDLNNTQMIDLLKNTDPDAAIGALSSLENDSISADTIEKFITDFKKPQLIMKMMSNMGEINKIEEDYRNGSYQPKQAVDQGAVAPSTDVAVASEVAPVEGEKDETEGTRPPGYIEPVGPAPVAPVGSDEEVEEEAEEEEAEDTDAPADADEEVTGDEVVVDTDDDEEVEQGEEDTEADDELDDDDQEEEDEDDRDPKAPKA
jgi:hypothetical protein